MKSMRKLNESPGHQHDQSVGIFLQEVPEFKDLGKSSHSRIKELIDVIVLHNDQQLPFDDGLKNDLIYVKQGRIQITLRLGRPKMLSLKTLYPNKTDEELFGADSDYPPEKTISVTAKQYFDFIKRNSKESGLKHYEVHRIVSKWHSKILRLRYSDYIKFINVDFKHKDALQELVIFNLPGLARVGGTKRKKAVTEQFKEIVSTLIFSLILLFVGP